MKITIAIALFVAAVVIFVGGKAIASERVQGQIFQALEGLRSLCLSYIILAIV